MQPADALGRPHIPGAAPGPPRGRSAGLSLALDRGRSAGRSVTRDRERGSGTILAISVIAAVIALIGMLVPVGVALAIKQQVSGAADAAALAAADTASGLVAGFPCENATRAAALNGTQLARCELDGLIATVAARTGYLGFEIAVEARAGPPGS